MVMVFCVSSVMLATSALLAPYLQNLAGYPVYTAGWAMAPRGIGTMASMFLAGTDGHAGGSAQDHGGGTAHPRRALCEMSTWTPDVTAGAR